MSNSLIKKLVIFVVAATLLFAFVRNFLERVDMEKKAEFGNLSEGLHDYYVAGHHFKVPGEYLSPNLRYRPGKATGLWLEGKMPFLSPRIPDPDYRFNNTDPDRVSFKLFTKNEPGKPIIESPSPRVIENSRTVLDNGWIRYEENMGRGSLNFLYYRELNTVMSSRMRCDQHRAGRNSSCEIISNYNNELELNIDFRLSRWEEWEEIERLAKSKFDEFYLGLGEE